MKTCLLSGTALDWAVAKASGIQNIGINVVTGLVWLIDGPFKAYCRPSTDWSQAGPIIAREEISIIRCADDYGRDCRGFCNNKRIPVWGAVIGQYGTQSSYEGECYAPQYEISESDVVYGPTPLVAAMRHFVFLKMGEDIELPKELL